MNIVVAKTYEQAHFFCEMVADPPINPHDRTTVIFSTSDRDAIAKSKGRQLTKDDLVHYYGRYYEGPYFGEVEMILLPLFRKAVDFDPKTIVRMYP